MKKTVKILSIVLIAIFILTTMASMALAVEPKDIPGTDPKAGELVSIGNQIIGIIKTIGTIISVGVLTVLGIKYMMGSAEEKAEYKKSMIPYLIGAVILFAATWIASAIYEFANNIK